MKSFYLFNSLTVSLLFILLVPNAFAIGGQTTVDRLDNVPTLSGDSDVTGGTTDSGASFFQDIYASFFADSPAIQEFEDRVEVEADKLRTDLTQKVTDRISNIGNDGSGFNFRTFIDNLLGDFFR